MRLDDLNTADPAALHEALHSCCAAESWIDRLVAGRPYVDAAALDAESDAATAALDEAGLAQALAGHPRIGERADSAWSRQEQSGVADADVDVRARIAAANREYEQRFGHVYLVCATGRSATELLAICEQRLGNDPDTERGVVRHELAAINRIRLAKLLAAA